MTTKSTRPSFARHSARSPPASPSSPRKATDGKDYGLTANSFNSVSMDPPMVLWSLGKKSSSLPVFAATDALCSAYPVRPTRKRCRTGSRRAAPTSSPAARWRAVTASVPLLDGCSARFECRVVHQYDGGDHVIFVGEVMNFDSFDRAAARSSTAATTAS